MRIDNDGKNENPIYDKQGNFLGTDDKGLQGEAIIMRKEDFKQGMSHEEALKKGTLFSDLNDYDRWNFMKKGWKHWQTLDQRPDWDGFVTIEEGIEWAKSHPGALANPTPDNMLYVDASKLDFGNISVNDFINGVGKSSPINLLNYGNLFMSLGNNRLRATVYALGRVNMILLDNDGHVSIVNDFNELSRRATDYDWNTGGNRLRNFLIHAERYRADLNDFHGFRVYYYGTGQLRTPLEINLNTGFVPEFPFEPKF